MADEQVDESLQRADKWSKIIALFFAMGVFGGASLVVDNVNFNAAVAAFAGIGVRIYIPYHASLSSGTGVPSQAIEATGNYHHGAVGGALVIGSLAALAAMVVEPRFWLALGAGTGTGVLSFLVLRTALPS
jgi:hypothetical protein